MEEGGCHELLGVLGVSGLGLDWGFLGDGKGEGVWYHEVACDEIGSGENDHDEADGEHEGADGSFGAVKLEPGSA